jgi:hypothetical protein
MLARLSRKVLFFREEKIPKEPSNYQDLLSGQARALHAVCLVIIAMQQMKTKFLSRRCMIDKADCSSQFCYRKS